jgi:methylmalonic aciduria homocystinuria type C protein
VNQALAEAGFEIQHAFDAHAVARELGWLAGAERCGILVGNTRALWPRFVAARPAGPDPLERYTEAAIAQAFPGARVYFAHRRYDGAFLPFQRLAIATGLAAAAPTGLVVHPVFGPWFALRAIVLVDAEPVARAPIAKPCTCDGSCEAARDSALHGGDWRAWLAVRDACSLREWRYSDEQIRYHYTKTWG